MPILADRIKEITITTGTGTIALGGAVTDFRSFNSVVSNGVTVRYVIDDYAGNWEIGNGVVGTNTLTRSVLESSNANALVSFAAGNKYVYIAAISVDYLPDQTANAGKILTTDGTTPSFSTVNSLLSTVTVSLGGTGLVTIPAGYIPYGNGVSALNYSSNLYFSGTALGIGTTNTSGGMVTVNGDISSKGLVITGQSFTTTSNVGMSLWYDSTGGTSVINSYNGVGFSPLPLRFQANLYNFTNSSSISTVVIDDIGNTFLTVGNLWQKAPSHTSISTTTTLTIAQIQTNIINTTGSAYTVTMPTGTDIDAGFPITTITNVGFDFHVINTASGTITIAINTGVTSLGSLTILTGISANFRLRRTAANTYILYRI